MDTIRRLRLETSERTEIEAKGASLGVSIEGKSYFSGEEAFTKAEEVKECLDTLKRIEVAEQDISLACVTADVHSGILSKSSSAQYYLRIDVHSLSRLGSVMSVLMQQKNAELAASYWKFPDFDKTKSELLERCVTNVKREAAVVAKALGVSLLGVHDLKIETQEPSTQIFSSRQAAFSGRAKGRSSKGPSIDTLIFSHSGDLSVKVIAEFEMSPFEQMAGVS